MIEIGKYNQLKIVRHKEPGLYLADESGEDVLLPNKYCPENYNLDDELKVFVYRDHENRKVATNITPKILLHEFALLQVTDVTDVGAFMDWGMEKELMVPFSEQRQRMEEGRWYIVFLDIDRVTDRLFASNKLNKFLDNEDLTVEEGDEVNSLVYQKTDLGYNVIVNHLHKGLIYNNEVFKSLHVGDQLKGYVKNIREDGKIDISLQPIGYGQSNDLNVDTVLDKLKSSDGFLPITDKSPPEEIYNTLGMSKKAFKKAVGALYKGKKIKIEPKGIKLIK